MRTQKRFTPDLLDRYRVEGRGLGTYGNYVPWHRVSRSDPASRGRSHLLHVSGRPLELLSDGELEAACFARMEPFLLDLREQFPLTLTPAAHELVAYDADLPCRPHPGTLELAKSLGIRHPRVTGNGRSEPWVMTTDLLLTLRGPGAHRLLLLAVARKVDAELHGRRTVEKLRLEHAYWAAREVVWLLVTPSIYDESVAQTLRRSSPWALQEDAPEHTRHTAVRVAQANVGRSLTYVLASIADQVGGAELAQSAFWQAVRCGELTLDLRRGWRPHLPVHLLSAGAFWELNPIVSRRSAWID